ncbi:MAG: MFS transporter, partial [Chloroflexi bacterium]|nr:MFS transporter [Chloroflexota bacterium]
MLPATGVIGADLGATGNETQLIISYIFIGLAGGQLLFGPLSDSFGRKPAVYIGITIFTVGCLVSLTAQVFSVMLCGRL